MQLIQHGGQAVMASIMATYVIFVVVGQAASQEAGNMTMTEMLKRWIVSQGKIIGGVETLISATPYVVSLLHSGSHVCGGCVIGARCIATAAHCCQVNASQMTINAGSNNSNSYQQKLFVDQVIVHEKYKRTGGIANDYDCCVLILTEDLDLSTKDCKMVAIADNNVTTNAGDMATVCGWGVTIQSGKTASALLRSVQVPIVATGVCKTNYSPTVISTNMLCAGLAGKDSCQGDSGGPLVDSKGNLIGIVSWGNGCGLAGYPGVYCKVAAIHQWLVSKCSGAKTATVVQAARAAKLISAARAAKKTSAARSARKW